MPWLHSFKKHSLVIAIVVLYLVADMVLTGKEIYVLNLLPLLLFVVYLAVARLDITYFAIVALTPVSVQLIDYYPSSPIDFAIPTEPMLFGIMLLLIYKTLHDRTFDLKILNHPVTYAILFNLFWIFITAITSTMPLVSFKFLMARIWFVLTYYLLAILVFRKYTGIPVFIWCYAIPMLGVVIFTISHHVQYGLFDKQAAHIVMAPFFRDHTSYGAVLAMLFFAVGGVVLNKGKKLLFKLFFGGAWILIAVALLLSYTRAAWISVLISLGVLALTLLKIRFRYILLAGIVGVVYLSGQRTAIVQKMQRNRQTSSATLSQHVQSISNISTDESNLERLNRWNSALRMFRERPVFGWGPGTYMFKYAPYQLSSEKTAISTDFGNLGNAHSEYIGPLTESGVLGALSFILIGIFSLLTGFRVYSNIRDKYLKQLVLGMILGLITYLVHGTLNNFLDTDKASALFWGFTGAFVSLDIYQGNLNARTVSHEFDTQD